MQINENLWKAIEDSGLKKWVVAHRSEMTPKSLSQIIRGFKVPTDEQKHLLARVLEKSTAELFPAARKSRPKA